MIEKPSDNHHPWRRPLLVAEFTALAILIATMAWLGRAPSPVSPAWLLIPAAASLVVFMSFLGLMYIRWVVAAGPGQHSRQKVLLALLALTLLGIWAFSIARTWQSLPA